LFFAVRFCVFFIFLLVCCWFCLFFLFFLVFLSFLCFYVCIVSLIFLLLLVFSCLFLLFLVFVYFVIVVSRVFLFFVFLLVRYEYGRPEIAENRRSRLGPHGKTEKNTSLKKIQHGMQVTQLIIIARCKNGGRGPTIIKSSYLLLQKESNSTTQLFFKTNLVMSQRFRGESIHVATQQQNLFFHEQP
jgi:hypothetical protein